MTFADKKEIEAFFKTERGIRYLTLKDLKAYPKINAFYKEVVKTATLDEISGVASYLPSEVIEAVFGVSGYEYFKQLESKVEGL